MTLDSDDVGEIERFESALDLNEGFAFHVIVTQTLDALQEALKRLPIEVLVRPRPDRHLSASAAANEILSDLNQAIDDAKGRPLLVDALVAHQVPAWALVFRRLNELRNGIERRHAGPLILALLPQGEQVLGREAPDLWSRRGSGMRLGRNTGVSQVLAGRDTWRVLKVTPPPPTDPRVFEDLCLDLFGELWNDPGIQKFGSPGQQQAGIDIFGRAGDRWIGVQCKVLNRQLSMKALEVEVRKAKTFRLGIQTFILATTGPRDPRVYEYARALSDEDLEIQIWAWEDIAEALALKSKTLDRYLTKSLQRVAPSRLPRMADPLFGREEDIAWLEEAWQNPKVNIATVYAWGGVGKTTLVASWVGGLAARDFDGADFFDWSFYSQGTRDQATSADGFIDQALRFFGDQEMANSARSSWDKGARLAELVGNRRALLILDGLEPLQYPPGPLAGELKDPALSALLRGLAAKNSGLCLITTREAITELETWRGRTILERQLENLSVAAGVELLRNAGVHGDSSELRALVMEVGGHPLTLSLAGRFLKQAHGGDVRKRSPLWLRNDQEIQGGHAFRVMESYERWLATGEQSGKQQLAVLRLLSLFDRPADSGCLARLREPPVIANLTEPLFEVLPEGGKWFQTPKPIGETAWRTILSQLAESQLIIDEGTSIDSHPLLREYFSRDLLRENPTAWRTAHGRVFDYLRDTTEYRPDTLVALQPLYQALFHACRAGRFQEALEVYRDRILRGGENYTWRQLGAFGAELGALACFFEAPWSRVTPSLAAAEQAWLLNQTAFCLRAIGRLREAIEPMRAGLAGALRLEEWQQAPLHALNLSELELTLGQVDAAIADAEQAVAFADRSGGAYLRMASRSTLADALHQADRRDSALAIFREAEALQTEREPKYPLLYSIHGFRYCDLLLDDVLQVLDKRPSSVAGVEEICVSVERRGRLLLEWSELNKAPLLDMALSHLTLGRTLLFRTLLGDNVYVRDTEIEIAKAVDGLRAAGQMQYLPLGLLTRAWFRAFSGDKMGAHADLEEAAEVAERGAMKLLLADVALYRARLFGDSSALAQAQILVEACGYRRRLPELENLERF